MSYGVAVIIALSILTVCLGLNIILMFRVLKSNQEIIEELRLLGNVLNRFQKTDTTEDPADYWKREG